MNDFDFYPVLESALRSSLDYLSTLETRPVGATSTLRDLRNRLNRPLLDHSLPSETSDSGASRGHSRWHSWFGRWSFFCLGGRRGATGSFGCGLADIRLGSERRSLLLRACRRHRRGGCRRVIKGAIGSSRHVFSWLCKRLPDGPRYLPCCGPASVAEKSRVECGTEWNDGCVSDQSTGLQSTWLD
jgi:hypothetical protein